MIELRENIFAVEVPKKAKYYRIDGVPNGAFYELIFYKDSDDIDFPDEIQDVKIIDLPPPGTWQIVCTSKSATEEQAAGIVQQILNGFYEDYNSWIDMSGFEGFEKATQSLNSLLVSKGCDINKHYLILKKV